MLPDKLRWDLELWYQGGPKFKGGPMNPNDAMVYILYTKLYKMYTTDVYKMYTNCIPYFDKLLYTFCIQNQKIYGS